MALLRARHPDFWLPQRVPLGPVELDRSHPLSEGLLGFWLLRGDPLLRNLATGAVGSFTGPPTLAASAIGPVWAFSGSGQYGTTEAIQLDQQHYTVAALAYPTALNSRFNIFDLNTGGQGASLEIGNSNSGTAVAAVNSGNYYAVTPNNTIIVNTWQHIAWTHDGPDQNSLKIYHDGADTNATIGPSGSMTTNSSVVRYIGQRAGGSQRFKGSIACVGLWDHALDPGLVAHLAAEPFAMLRPVTRRRWYVPASATQSYTLAGTLAATLESATLSSAAKLAIAAALSAALADVTLSADATLVSPGIHGELVATLANATLSAAGALAIVGSLSTTLEGARLSARGGNPNAVSTTADTLLRHRRRRWR